MAGSFIRKFTKWIFISLTILVCIVFLLACLSPYVSPAKWAPIGFLSLAAPYLAVLLIFSVIFWLVAKPVFSLMPLITLLIGWKQLSVICAWHPSHSFSSEHKPDSVLRIITWNVRGLYGISNSPYTQNKNRNEIASLVNNLDPDVICLQEFNYLTNPGELNYGNVNLFTKNSPYYYFSKDFTNKAHSYFGGTILFSKYPIIDTFKIKFTGFNSESMIYADIVKGKDTIRVYTQHLQSFDFTNTDYRNMEKIKDPDKASIQASKNLYSKMKGAFLQRAWQADTVRKSLDKSPYPSIICGDFNDVPNSYTYFHIRGNRQDAFLSSSFGIGRSYNALAPTLRIDYILPDEHFNILQFDMVDEGLSDHHLLVTDVSLKK